MVTQKCHPGAVVDTPCELTLTLSSVSDSYHTWCFWQWCEWPGTFSYLIIRFFRCNDFYMKDKAERRKDLFDPWIQRLLVCGLLAPRLWVWGVVKHLGSRSTWQSMVGHPTAVRKQREIGWLRIGFSSRYKLSEPPTTVFQQSRHTHQWIHPSKHSRSSASNHFSMIGSASWGPSLHNDVCGGNPS